MTVIMDAHEKGNMRGLLEAHCDEVRVMDDFSADYAVSGALIERKGWEEVAGRMMDSDRDLMVQVDELASAAAALDCEPAVLLEGEIGHELRHTSLDRARVPEYLAGLHVIGVTVVVSTGRECTARIMSRLEDDAPPDVTRVRGSPQREENVPRFVVSSLPSVGKGRAEDLLDHFGSAGSVMAASEAELRDVDGIGPAIASDIRDALDR